MNKNGGNKNPLPGQIDLGLLARTKLAEIINEAQANGTTHKVLQLKVGTDISRRLSKKTTPDQISFYCGNVSIEALMVDPSIVAELIGDENVSAIRKEAEEKCSVIEQRRAPSDPYAVSQVLFLKKQQDVTNKDRLESNREHDPYAINVSAGQFFNNTQH